MRNGFKHLAAGLLSLVLIMGWLAPSALAASDTDADTGITPYAIRCPECGGSASTSTNWQDRLVDIEDKPCVHCPHGTDEWGTKIGHTLELCPNCGWNQTYETRVPMIIRCHGSF